ncbi:MAG: trigger factor [Candidatus Magasanikbacteria bacterium]
MDYKINELDGSEVEIEITVEPEEYKEDMKKAAERISKEVDIDGFRQGNAPYRVIKNEVGEMKIMQEAIQTIAQRTYVKALKKEDIESIGSPEVDIKKMAPGDSVEFTATVGVMPEVDLADPSELEVEKEVKEVKEEDVQDSIDSLRKMHADEEIKEGPAEGDDKLVLDMNMSVDGVPVEGGQAKDYQVYLDEDEQHIPGFNEKVEGMEAGEEKEFTLDFPENHYQQNLAGKTVDFDVTVNEVYSQELPELDDDFAKKMGQEDVEGIKNLIKENLKQEAKKKENQQFEIKLLNKMVEESEFEEIPEVLVDAERQKMYEELKNDLDKNGVTIEQYLEDIKKTEEELLEGFTEQATKRAKTALISRKLAEKNEDLQPKEEEIEQEIERIRQANQGNEEMEERLQNQEVKNTIATTVQNRKVVEWLKDQVEVKEKKEE